MPVYGLPELLADISPELRRRMQGKACFNFTRVDERALRGARVPDRDGHRALPRTSSRPERR